MPLNPKKIRERREKLNLTQDEAASRAKIPRPRWTLIESGGRNDPALSTAERIAKSLECELAEILKGAGQDLAENRPKFGGISSAIRSSESMDRQ